MRETKEERNVMSFKQGLSGVQAAAEEQEKWVDDSSVDHRGRPPLRSATGSWKAAFFIIRKHRSIV